MREISGRKDRTGRTPAGGSVAPIGVGRPPSPSVLALLRTSVAGYFLSDTHGGAGGGGPWWRRRGKASLAVAAMPFAVSREEILEECTLSLQHVIHSVPVLSCLLGRAHVSAEPAVKPMPVLLSCHPLRGDSRTGPMVAWMTCVPLSARRLPPRHNGGRA